MISTTQTAFDRLKKDLMQKDSEIAYLQAKLNMVNELGEII